MNSNAENSLVKYKERYNSNKTEEPGDTCKTTGNNHVPVNETENVGVTDLPTDKTAVSEEVSELVTKMGDSVTLETKPEMELAEEDLEQWLDDILDD